MDKETRENLERIGEAFKVAANNIVNGENKPLIKKKRKSHIKKLLCDMFK